METQFVFKKETRQNGIQRGPISFFGLLLPMPTYRNAAPDPASAQYWHRVFHFPIMQLFSHLAGNSSLSRSICVAEKRGRPTFSRCGFCYKKLERGYTGRARVGHGLWVEGGSASALSSQMEKQDRGRV